MTQEALFWMIAVQLSVSILTGLLFLKVFRKGQKKDTSERP